MLRTIGHKYLWVAGALSLATLTGFIGQRVGRAQVKPEGGLLGQRAAPTPLYYGAIVCADCHEAPKRSDPDPVLCRCTESKIWEQQDKHKNAYLVLRSERAKRMAELLGFKDAASERSCLSCHGVDNRNPNVKTDKTFKAEEGVSCVACHGAYLEWVDMHGARLRRDKWRSLSREEKEKDYGMTDLWNPATRARTCASCHIGDSKQGKVVTHAMYAAGHPPLPGVEVSTFSDAMPRHWQYLKEKQAAAQKLLDYNPEELEKTKLVVVGGVVNLQEAMILLAAEAEARARAAEPEDQFLDFAQIDCYACHHELQSPSWRQARGYSGKPGRPQFRQWPLALVKLGMHHVGQDDRMPELAKKLSALHGAFDTQPFGKLDQVTRAASDLAEWCKQLEASLASKSVKYNRAAAVGLLRHLSALSSAEVPDYDTARQLAWAFKTIYSDLAESGSKPPNDSAFQTGFQALDDELKLGLPSGQEHQILAELPLALKKIAGYDPVRFLQVFQQLSKLLPPN